MSTINLTDNFGLNITVAPGLASSIAKYFRDEVKLGFKDFNFSAIQSTTLDKIPPGESKAGLVFSEPVDIGLQDVQLKIGAGASAAISVLLQRDNDSLKNDIFGDPLKVAADQAYCSFSMTANVSADLSDKLNDLKFGFNAGSQIQVSNQRLFGLAPAPTALSALKDTLANFVIPGDIDDLNAIAAGTRCAVDGTGTLKFSGNFELDFQTNPLASVAVPLSSSPISVTSGGSLKISASVTLTGEFQIRVTKQQDHTIRLGVYRKKDQQFDVTVTPSFGLSVSLGQTDLIEKLVTLISANPTADKKALQAAGLDDATITAITSAIKAGVQRRLEIAVQAEMTAIAEQDAAFLFDIDLAKLDPTSRAALHLALEGDFSSITADTLAGVTLVRSIQQTVTTKKHSLTVNLLGIFNSTTVSQLMVTGKVLYEAETGSLVITDSATGIRVQATTLNFAADPDKLRLLCVQSFTITAAYRGSKTAVGDPSLSSALIMFESHSQTKPQVMKDLLSVPQALGLLSGPDGSRLLDHVPEFGRSTLYAEDRFDESLCKQLFRRGAQARPQLDYERAGRAALALIVPPDDPNNYRRIIALQDGVWNQLKTIGSPAMFHQVLPALTDLQLAVVGSDYLLLIWWAESMSKMAKVLEEVEGFFAAHPTPDPGDHQLTALRSKLTKVIADVVAKTKPEYGRPWGLIAIDQVLFPQAKAKIQLTSKTFSLALKR